MHLVIKIVILAHPRRQCVVVALIKNQWNKIYRKSMAGSDLGQEQGESLKDWSLRRSEEPESAHDDSNYI